MSQLLIKTLAVAVIASYTAIGAYDISRRIENTNLKAIEVQSLNSQTKELQLRYTDLNKQLDNAKQNKSVSEKKVKELLKEKKELENEKKRLQSELQAKRQARSNLAKTSDKIINTVTGTQTASASSSSKEQLMAAAGIAKADWPSVNEIISRESGWGHTRWNTTGSGAYGLCQSLPASKMASAGADYMTNPVTQLRWCHEYAKQYGGWTRAAEFSRCVGYCYSARTGSYINKDHQWW